MIHVLNPRSTNRTWSDTHFWHLIKILMDESEEHHARPTSALAFERMPQLVYMRNPSDDWTGVTNTAERKRRQNRLNQRAYRRRKVIQHGDILVSSVRATSSDHEELENREQLQQQQLWWQRLQDTGISDGTDTGQGYLMLAYPSKCARVRAFMQKVYQEYSLNAPRPTYLHKLIRLNVLNAMADNAKALGFPVEGLCQDELISPFNEVGPCLPGVTTPLPSCPKSLLPTDLQRTLTHHPWIDLWPVPQMRDNMLRGLTAGLFDEDELCSDLLNVDDDGSSEKPSLIVWGAPWDTQGWEVTVAFLRKWGWLLRGCPDILDSTNSWRTKRGEKELVLNVFQ
ncbi:hypothetical protein F4677DRAFT_415763 [Hypoxylon crocopeplum]|nr:hypothetical protein F4677DRAFT_415763 [Hypoxylon crocopeplum]